MAAGGVSTENQPSFKEVLRVISTIALPDRRSKIELLVGTVVLAAILIWLYW